MSFPLDGTKQQSRGTKRAVAQVTLHTSENAPGTRNAALAGFIRGRSDYGSYHCIVDTFGDRLQLAGFWSKVWHAPAVNGFAMGLSFVTRARDWNALSDRARTALVNAGAMEAHRYSRWCVANGAGAVPATRLSGAQARAGGRGFSTHGEIQPADRTDPGATFPWNQFLAEYRRLEGGGSTSKPSAPSTPAPKPAPKPAPAPQLSWARVKPFTGKRADGIIRTGPGTKHKKVREVYRWEWLYMNGRSSGAWRGLGDGLWIHKDNIIPEPASSNGPKQVNGLSSGQFPDRNIPINGTNTYEYRHAGVDLAARLGESKGSTQARLARALKKRHAYLRSVNGNVRTIKTHLAKLGHYKGNVDNKNNVPFREGAKRWYNEQKTHYTPKPPTAHRWARNFKG